MPTTNFFHPMYVHVDIKDILNKNKNIFEKMSEYVGFSPPPTYFLHIRCGSVTIANQPSKPSQIAYVGSMRVGVRILHIHSFFRKCFYSCILMVCCPWLQSIRAAWQWRLLLFLPAGRRGGQWPGQWPGPSRRRGALVSTIYSALH